MGNLFLLKLIIFILVCYKIPHFKHLRVFRCTTYVKNTKPHIKKLDYQSQKMAYFGIEDSTKAHRRYDPQHEKIHVSRDVIFKEQKKWDRCRVGDNK